MAYQLKSTGIAASVAMMIAVDPDTGTIKDFASAAVTADMTVGANVTTGSQSWDGNTRRYWVCGTGTADADFVKFGTNKPSWSNNSNGTERTVVVICEAAGSYVRAFGSTSSHYIAAQNGGAGGATLPYIIGCGYGASSVDGGAAGLSAGQKAIWGFSMKHGVSCTAYWALHDAASMSKSVESAPSDVSASNNFSLNYVGRRNDSTGHQQDKYFAIIIFNSELTEAQWDALRDDWFGTLLEAAGAGISGTASQTVGQLSQSATGTVTSGITGSGAQTLAAITQAAAGSVSGVPSITGSASQTLAAFAQSAAGAVTTPSIVLGPFANNAGLPGGLLANHAIAHAVVLRASDRNLTLSLGGLATDASGYLTIASTSLVVGTAYMLASWNADGSAAGIKRAVAS